MADCLMEERWLFGAQIRDGGERKFGFCAF